MNNGLFYKIRRTVRQTQGFNWDDDIKVNFKRKDLKKPFRNKPDPLHDRLIFEDEENPNRNKFRQTQPTTPRTTTVAVPGMETPRTPCEDRCLTTPEYNPVCGDDRLTYFSRQRLQCAIKCGKRE